MRTRFRTALVAAAALATLAFANAALAANTGSVTVWHTPQTLASSQSTTVHVNVPQTTDPIAAVNIYSGTGYTLNTSQAAGTQIGNVDVNGRRLRAGEHHRVVPDGDRPRVGSEGGVRERERRDCGCDDEHRAQACVHAACPFVVMTLQEVVRGHSRNRAGSAPGTSWRSESSRTARS